MNLLLSRSSLQRIALSAGSRTCSKPPASIPSNRNILRAGPVRALTVAATEGVRPESTSRGAYGFNTMPAGHQATVGHLKTFELPETVTGSASDRKLGKDMIDSFRKDGIFQISMTPCQESVFHEALVRSKDFFKQPHEYKARHVDSQSFAGYIASGEEITDGIADYSEIFTVTKDLPETDQRVQARWPCHGPCPWPNEEYKEIMTNYMNNLGEYGEKLLKLTALGLGLEKETLTQLTDDGWHHMRILRFPPTNKTNGKGKAGRGIGSHTDYGLLVIASQDHVGGLFIRPPIQGEVIKNWESSAAGLNENDSKWVYVPPIPGVFTVFPGDMMQYITNSYLPSTPHKVGLNTAERFTFAYFHEPNFNAVIKPAPQYDPVSAAMKSEGIHYGTHFTNMFMRNYPERITAKRVREEGRMRILEDLSTLAKQR